MDEATATALRELVDLAETMPGGFRPEFELGYWAGVTDADAWYVRFEGDISDGEILITAHSASEALRRAIEEVRSQVEPER